MLRDAMSSPVCDGPIDSDSKRYRCRERFCRRPLVKEESLVKKVVAAAVAAGVLSVGFAGTVQAAPHSDGWGGAARVKASSRWRRSTSTGSVARPACDGVPVLVPGVRRRIT